MPHLSSAHDGVRRRLRGRAPAGTTVLLAVAAAGSVAGPTGLAGLAPGGEPRLVTAFALLAAAGGHLWRARHRGPVPLPAAGPNPQDGGGRQALRHGAADGGKRHAGADDSASADGHGRGGEETSLWRLRTTVADSPGSLGRICTALAGAGADIVTLQTHPLAQGTVDEFLLRAPAALPASALARTVDAAGGADTWLERADAHDLVDAPTRILTLATRTALDPAELPLALRELLGRCAVSSTPAHGAPGGADTGEDDALEQAGEVLGTTVMRLRDPSGGTITVRREHLPFTPSEFARARALVELDARLGARGSAGRRRLTLPEGAGLTIRPAGPQDRAAAADLHARCSPATLAMRYHGPAADSDRYLDHLLSPRFGRSMAVETATGRLVALGHLLWDGDGDTESEVALIVEDEWQRRGVGGALLRKLVESAARSRRESVYAVTRPANTGMAAVMRRLGLPLDYQVEAGTLVITAALPTTPEDGEPGPHIAPLPWTAGHPH